MSTLIAPERAPRTGGLESPPARARESFLASNARTLLAASGFVMLGFVVVHLAGNLLTFAGAAPFNAYARWLRDVGSPLMPESGLLWVARVVLAGALAAHLASHLYLMTHPDALSGPALGPFDPMPPWYATLPVGVFQVSGALIAAFVAFHLAQLTIGAIHPAFIAAGPYDETLVALRFWPVSVAYIGAAMAVGMHVLPGTWTGLRSLGLIRPRTAGLASILSPAVALVLTFGLSAVPLAVLLGVLR